MKESRRFHLGKGLSDSNFNLKIAFGDWQNTLEQSSAANQARIILQFMDSGNYGNMPGNTDLVDLSTSNYPMTSSQWQNAGSTLTFTVPPKLRNGCYMLFVVANAVPSLGWIIDFNTGVPISSASYKTMVGSAANWVWKTPVSTDSVVSGSPDDWTWLLWTHGLDRKVPTLQGSATSWIWVGE